MSDRELDLAKIIDILESKIAELRDIWINMPFSAEGKDNLEDLMIKIKKKILFLKDTCRHHKATRIIIDGQTSTELDKMYDSIRQDQPLQATIGHLTKFVEKIDLIVGQSLKRESYWFYEIPPKPREKARPSGLYVPKISRDEEKGIEEVTSDLTEKVSLDLAEVESPKPDGELSPRKDHARQVDPDEAWGAPYLPKAKPPPPQPPRKAAPPPRVVNTGFSQETIPDKSLKRKMPLRCGERYFFWLEIGPPQKESMEETPVDIPAVPAEALLTVALFGFKGELEVTPGADVGELKVQKDLTVCVTRQPLAESPPRSARLKQRLFFPVTAPGQSGEYRLRCHIYWGQILLQSRIIHALVRKQPQPVSRGQKALRSALDYTLSPTLQPAAITKLQEHRLSIFMNSNGDGTHSFHIFGTDGQERCKRDDVRFKEGELQGMITQARGTLRLASWGNDQEWEEGIPYKYKDRKLNWDRLTKDLTNMAKWGYDFYDKICPRLAGNEQAVAEMEKVLAEPGFIQLAMKESPSYVLPAALIYDYPLDTGAKSFSLCNSFAEALKKGQPLEDLECFHGNCPSRADPTAICPSGFWGFRHYLGMPLSVRKGPDMPPFIPVQQDLRLSMIVATNLQLLQGHRDAVKALRALGSQTVWNYAEERDAAFKLLQESPHVVYFYCHGGQTRGKPYLQVGSGDQINPSNFRARKIQWEAPRPLVFINGCHTAAVEPLQALEFISPLVTYAHGAGVIGTEITIFEELATVFAEECLGRFLQGEAIGAALRRARLRLLQEGNPLGLVYIPFVIATLALKDQGAAALSGLKPPTTGEVRVEEDKVWIGDTWVERRQG